MKKIDVLCIGSPDIVGDAIGPVIGTKLEAMMFYNDVKVIGTLRNPVNNFNYKSRLMDLREDAYLIVVDAAMGDPGIIKISSEPLEAGSAVGSTKEPIGDMSVLCYTGSSIKEMQNSKAEFIYNMSVHVINRLKDMLGYNKI